MKRLDWFDRQFQFGYTPSMLPFFLERLEGTIVRLDKKIADTSESVLTWQPEGKWSIKQHIGHLAEVDAVVLRRISEILSGVSPMSSAVFPLTHNYNDKSSLHPRLNVPMTIVDLAFFDAEHDDHHLVRINEIKRIGRG